jgi:hypothetical protein
MKHTLLFVTIDDITCIERDARRVPDGKGGHKKDFNKTTREYNTVDFPVYWMNHLNPAFNKGNKEFPRWSKINTKTGEMVYKDMPHLKMLQDHARTPDKDDLHYPQNCYNDLFTGGHYVVVDENAGKRRFDPAKDCHILRDAVEMRTREDLQEVYKFWLKLGEHTRDNDERTYATLEWARQFYDKEMVQKREQRLTRRVTITIEEFDDFEFTGE